MSNAHIVLHHGKNQTNLGLLILENTLCEQSINKFVGKSLNCFFMKSFCCIMNTCSVGTPSTFPLTLFFCTSSLSSELCIFRKPFSPRLTATVLESQNHLLRPSFKGYFILLQTPASLSM